VHVVVNHLRFRDPLSAETIDGMRNAIGLVVEAGD
jgi:hypothetical protein